MESNQLYLFKDRRFLPIFIVQFCGCLNDSILKNALIILVTFKLASELSISTEYLVLMVNGAFIAPFFIFASLAGQIADRYERSVIVKIIKALEIGVILLAAYGFYHTKLSLLYICVALMGVHSTFFGPIKYSVLPDKLRKDELLGANGFVEAGTFFSILIGTMIGGFYTVNDSLIIALSVIISIIGLIASFFMPKSGNSNSDIKLNLNIVRETIEIVKYSYSKKQVYLAILGISWFWFIGSTIIAQLPMFTKNILGADENVANLFLAVFSIGVGLGSFLCNKILSRQITTKYVFISALGISICGIDLYFAGHIASINYEPENLRTVTEFLSRKHCWRIVIDLFLLAIAGGLYVVPLFAVMQHFSSPAYRSRVVAANNLINSIFMIGSTAVLSLLFYLNFSIPSAILLISVINFIVAVHIYRLIPNTKVVPLKVWRFIFKSFFSLIYSIEVKGLENYKKTGQRTIIVANHLSYIDPALIACYIPENIIFAIGMTVSNEWWVKPFLKIIKTLPVDPHSPMAVKTLIEKVKNNRKIAIFPEGRISVTGSLMKIYEGPAMIADKAEAKILPIRVEGTQFTIFSKTRCVLSKPFSFRQKITITVLPPTKFSPPEHLGGKERRKFLGDALYDIMNDMLFDSSEYKVTLFQGLINSAKTYGMNKRVIHDITNNSVSYRGLLMKSFIMSNFISSIARREDAIGIMLPNTTVGVITFFAAQALGKVPVMINFTSGAPNIVSACQTASVKQIFTSRKFVRKADLSEVVTELKNAAVSVIYLEDLRPKVTIFMRIKGIFGALFPQRYYESICPFASRYENRPAVILFTSGTEGKPKAVALSHQNIQANKFQAVSRFDFGPNDLAFNALPMFHCFGLTGILIMAFSGIRTFLYPSPLHYRVIPEIVYDVGATVMFSTDTFLSGYAAYADPYDFYSLRLIIAGAEKLKAKTRQLWLDKFGIKIFEGYGVTETSPVISANTPMHEKPGTVGRLFSKIEYFLQPVEGINNGGRLCVKGPNVMLGYIFPDNPGVIVPPEVKNLGEGWYDTGDIVNVDQEGYLAILGREKRFAKIGGEMISLTAVEELVSAADKEHMFAVVSIEDEKRGEKIILFTTNKNLSREHLTQIVKERQMQELLIPKVIIYIKEIPVLATGKTNYRAILSLAQSYKDES